MTRLASLADQVRALDAYGDVLVEETPTGVRLTQREFGVSLTVTDETTAEDAMAELTRLTDAHINDDEEDWA